MSAPHLLDRTSGLVTKTTYSRRLSNYSSYLFLLGNGSDESFLPRWENFTLVLEAFSRKYIYSIPSDGGKSLLLSSHLEIDISLKFSNQKLQSPSERDRIYRP